MWRHASLSSSTSRESPHAATNEGSRYFPSSTSAPNQNTALRVRPHSQTRNYRSLTLNVFNTFYHFPARCIWDVERNSSLIGLAGPNCSCKPCWNMYYCADSTLMKSLIYMESSQKYLGWGYTLIFRLTWFLTSSANSAMMMKLKSRASSKFEWISWLFGCRRACKTLCNWLTRLSSRWQSKKKRNGAGGCFSYCLVPGWTRSTWALSRRFLPGMNPWIFHPYTPKYCLKTCL